MGNGLDDTPGGPIEVVELTDDGRPGPRPRNASRRTRPSKRGLVIAAAVVVVVAAVSVWQTRARHSLTMREQWRNDLHLGATEEAFVLGQHDGMLFVQLSFRSDTNTAIVALDATRGAVRWSAADSQEQQPIFAGGLVAFATASNGPTVVADARTGHVVATLAVVSSAGGPCAISSGVVAYVALRSIGDMGNIAGFDMRTGRQRWLRHDARLNDVCPPSDGTSFLMGDGTLDIATGRAHPYPTVHGALPIVATPTTAVECAIVKQPASVEGIDLRRSRRRWRLPGWRCANAPDDAPAGGHTVVVTRGDDLRVVDIDSGATLSSTTQTKLGWHPSCFTCDGAAAGTAYLHGDALITQADDPCSTPVNVLRGGRIVAVPFASEIDAFDTGMVVLRADPGRGCAPSSLDLLDTQGRLQMHLPLANGIGQLSRGSLEGHTLYVVNTEGVLIALRIS